MTRDFIYKCCRMAAAHGFPLTGFGNDCGPSGSPKEVLKKRYKKFIDLYGPLLSATETASEPEFTDILDGINNYSSKLRAKVTFYGHYGEVTYSSDQAEHTFRFSNAPELLAFLKSLEIKVKAEQGGS